MLHRSSKVRQYKDDCTDGTEYHTDLQPPALTTAQVVPNASATQREITQHVPFTLLRVSWL